MVRSAHRFSSTLLGANGCRRNLSKNAPTFLIIFKYNTFTQRRFVSEKILRCRESLTTLSSDSFISFFVFVRSLERVRCSSYKSLIEALRGQKGRVDEFLYRLNKSVASGLFIGFNELFCVEFKCFEKLRECLFSTELFLRVEESLPKKPR